MTPNRPCRNPNEVWPEIAEALEGLHDNQYALAVALEGTLKGARRALRKRSAGCEDLNAEAGHIVREIFPHDELAEAERIFGQRPVAAKSGRYKTVHGHFIEELFDKPLEDLAPGEEGILVPTGSVQVLPRDNAQDKERYAERGNRLTVRAVPWDLPYGIFERSVPETAPYGIRFALRWPSPERTQLLEDLYSLLEVEILAIERDRRMLASTSPVVDPIAVERDSLVKAFQGREQVRLGPEITILKICKAIPMDPSTFYAWKSNKPNPKKNTAGVNITIRNFLLTGSLPDVPDVDNQSA